jgi:hypothetical protein
MEYAAVGVVGTVVGSDEGAENEVCGYHQLTERKGAVKRGGDCI